MSQTSGGIVRMPSTALNGNLSEHYKLAFVSDYLVRSGPAAPVLCVQRFLVLCVQCYSVFAEVL